MSFSAYTGSLTLSTNYNAAVNGPNSSLNFPATSNNNTLNARTSYSIGGNVIGGINEEACNILTVPASSSATINLQSLTDVLGFTGIVLVRLKKWLLWLLSPNDDSVAGTSCSGVTIGNAGSNPFPFNFTAATTTFLLNGVPAGTGDKEGYATDSAAGFTVSATACNVLVTNNDSSHAASLLYNFGGSTT